MDAVTALPAWLVEECHHVVGDIAETLAILCAHGDASTGGDGSRSFMIVSFLAVLEMIRLKLIRVFQSGSFGAIRVYKRARPADAPHPIGDPEASSK